MQISEGYICTVYDSYLQRCVPLYLCTYDVYIYPTFQLTAPAGNARRKFTVGAWCQIQAELDYVVIHYITHVLLLLNFFSFSYPYSCRIDKWALSAGSWFGSQNVESVMPPMCTSDGTSILSFKFSKRF